MKNDYDDLFKLLALAVVIAIAIGFLPLILIWSVNTLFTLSIAYTKENWFAALVLLALIQGESKFFFKSHKSSESSNYSKY